MFSHSHSSYVLTSVLQQVLISFGVGLLYLILCTGVPLLPRNSHTPRAPPVSCWRKLRSSVEGSLPIFSDTASFLAMTWQIAALSQLEVAVQTRDDALMLCLTANAYMFIALAALCTARRDLRRPKSRILFLLVSTLLCLAVSVLAGWKILKVDQFPMESCLPFFKHHLDDVNKFFAVLSSVFWPLAALIWILILIPSVQYRRWTEVSKYCLLLFCEVVMVVLAAIVLHVFIPRDQLQMMTGHGLETQFSFGQTLSILVWLPVFVEFIFVLLCKCNTHFLTQSRRNVVLLFDPQMVRKRG